MNPQWRKRVSAVVVSMSDDQLVVTIHDKGTRRTPASVAGTMTLAMGEVLGGWAWTVAGPLRYWADAQLRAWCTMVGGGVNRTVALIFAARDAAAEWRQRRYREEKARTCE